MCLEVNFRYLYLNYQFECFVEMLISVGLNATWVRNANFLSAISLPSTG